MSMQPTSWFAFLFSFSFSVMAIMISQVLGCGRYFWDLSSSAGDVSIVLLWVYFKLLLFNKPVILIVTLHLSAPSCIVTIMTSLLLYVPLIDHHSASQPAKLGLVAFTLNSPEVMLLHQPNSENTKIYTMMDSTNST